MTRYAVVSRGTREEIAAYLPDNYEIVHWSNEPDGKGQAVIAGDDVAGWTLDDIVCGAALVAALVPIAPFVRLDSVAVGATHLALRDLGPHDGFTASEQARYSSSLSTEMIQFERDGARAIAAVHASLGELVVVDLFLQFAATPSHIGGVPLSVSRLPGALLPFEFGRRMTTEIAAAPVAIVGVRHPVIQSVVHPLILRYSVIPRYASGMIQCREYPTYGDANEACVAAMN